MSLISLYLFSRESCPISIGHGMIMTEKGEKVMLKGEVITTSKAAPAGTLRGALYAQTSAPSLSRLNDMALVFEIERGADGSFKDKTWEWK